MGCREPAHVEQLYSVREFVGKKFAVAPFNTDNVDTVYMDDGEIACGGSRARARAARVAH